MDKFKGRKLNTNTMMYEFDDKSGVSIPYEIKEDFMNVVVAEQIVEYNTRLGKVLGGNFWKAQSIIWDYKDKRANRIKSFIENILNYYIYK